MGLDQVLFKNTKEDNIEVIRWRKCNQIHGYFHRLVGGVENLEEYPVTIQQLQELRDTCQKVVDNPELAEKLLPNMEGFFFGTYDYDKFYFEELQDTIEQLDEVISRDDGEAEYCYWAWW